MEKAGVGGGFIAYHDGQFNVATDFGFSVYPDGQFNVAKDCPSIDPKSTKGNSRHPQPKLDNEKDRRSEIETKKMRINYDKEYRNNPRRSKNFIIEKLKGPNRRYIKRTNTPTIRP